MSFPSRFLLLLSSFGLIVLVGCNSDSEVSFSERSMPQNSIVEGRAQLEPVRRAGNTYRDELTKNAMRGLDYSSGRVKVVAALEKEVTAGLTIRDAEQCCHQGDQSLRSGHAIKSLEWLTKAVILNPNEAEYYVRLGVTLLAKKKKEFAEVAFRSALDLNANSEFAQEMLAMTISGWPQRFDEAIANYEKVVDLNPENGHAYSRMAILHHYQNRPNQAKKFVTLAEASGYSVPSQFKNLLVNGLSPLQLNAGDLPNIGDQTRVDLTNPAPGNETTAASSEFDPDCVVAGWNDYREGSARSGFAVTTDGGDTWQDFLLRPPVQNQNTAEGDPMTAYDNRTGTMWAGAVSFGISGGIYIARKDPGQANFGPADMAIAVGGADKCWMAAGPDPNDSDQTRLYIGYNQGLLISTDMGDSFSGPFPFPEFGLGWLPRIGPNGELYLTYWNTSDQVKMLRSFDGGLTFDPPITIATRMDVWFVDGSRFPGRFRCPPLVTSAVNPTNGAIYATYFDTTDNENGNANVDIYFTKSTDQGTTWSTPAILNSDASTPGDQFFPWIEVDTGGRLHVIFYDSRSVAQNDNQTDTQLEPSCILEAYYAFSDDEGGSWTEMVLTPAPFDTANDGFDGEFIGDYLGMATTGTTVYPCYLATDEKTSNVFVHKITPAFILGDVNGDGEVSLLDIQPFVNAVVNNEFSKAADIDGDGDVTLLDIAGFVTLIQSN